MNSMTYQYLVNYRVRDGNTQSNICYHASSFRLYKPKIKFESLINSMKLTFHRHMHGEQRAKITLETTIDFGSCNWYQIKAYDMICA